MEDRLFILEITFREISFANLYNFSKLWYSGLRKACHRAHKYGIQSHTLFSQMKLNHSANKKYCEL